MKETVCVDLDGVLAKYDGWKGYEFFGDPIEGSVDFTKQLKEKYRVLIYTTRTTRRYNKTNMTVEELKELVKNWLDKHGYHYDSIYVGQGKPLCIAYVDDRSIHCDPQSNGGRAFEYALFGIERISKTSPSVTDD